MLSFKRCCLKVYNFADSYKYEWWNGSALDSVYVKVYVIMENYTYNSIEVLKSFEVVFVTRQLSKPSYD